MARLDEKIENFIEMNGGSLGVDIPETVLGNLAQAIELRPYQRDAVERLVFYLGHKTLRVRPSHILFHMATGSGKTVIMAAAILHLYEQGYRNFLFFVNSTQIVRKTKANFLDPGSSKHLFRDPIVIGTRNVTVREVSTFAEAGEDDINLLFTTVQGLHTLVNDPKENAVSLDDFKTGRTVLISDEAHHLNAETKAGRGAEEESEVLSWEGTVRRILNAHPENILLDFSATVDLKNSDIAAKYADKLLMDYPLRRFREDRYSKDIELRQVSGAIIDRMLGAILISQHRRRRAAAYGIDLKPVVMMKSKRIADSAENATAFQVLLRNLSGARLLVLRAAVPADDKPLVAAFDYLLDERGTAPEDLARELQAEFAPERTVNVNDPKDLEAQQILLNSLEDRENPIRVVFAVDKLNEGWDVLNLFDIVRLYDGVDSKKGVPGKTTMAEAQLIGRGARYWPFRDPDDTEAHAHLRRFDADLANPLRLLEVMHYHCAHNPNYITDIRTALRQTGAMADTERRVTLKVRESFKATDFYQLYPIYVNDRRERDRSTVTGLADVLPPQPLEWTIPVTAQAVVTGAFDAAPAPAAAAAPMVAREIVLRDLGLATLRRAADERPELRFDALRRLFPKLTSMTDFLTDDAYAGGLKVTLRGAEPDPAKLDPSVRLAAARQLLGTLSQAMDDASRTFEGTDFRPEPLTRIVTDKDIKIVEQGEAQKSWRESDILKDIDPVTADWHIYDDCYGTSEEKHLVRFLADRMTDLRAAYKEVYLLRNERLFRIHRPSDGAAHAPDYVLFLRREEGETGMVWQVFVEPKGGHLLEKDAWKEDFLTGLSIDKPATTLFEVGPYRIRGLPFFSREGGRTDAFEASFKLLSPVVSGPLSA